jgi:predicted NBD/HSP70 family sugar kinase
MSDRKDIVIGVEIEPELIRAVAYDDALIPRGKARRSTKLMRGTAAVIERVAQCAADAADEGDLRLKEVGAVGVACPGYVDLADERKVTSAMLHWTAVPLEPLLATHLGLPVRAGNRVHLATRAAWLEDFHRRPGVVATLLWDGNLGGGIVRDGRLLDATEAPEFHRLIEAVQPAWAQRVPAEWRTRAARDWRKALKRGEPAVRGFVEESLIELGRITARLAAE